MNATQPALTAPPGLGEERQALLRQLVDGLEPAQLYWIAAYAAQQAAHPAARPVPASAVRLTVLYGSQTGNARRVAERFAAEAEANGLPVRLLRAGAYPVRELADERYLAVVVSTQGEGEPPDDARGFVEFLASRRAPKLPKLHYAVLGLGDSSYPLFNAMGRSVDARLAELGAQRLAPLAEADVDIEPVAGPWTEGALALVREKLTRELPTASVTPLRAAPTRPQFHRDRPFPAPVLANQRIVSRHADRDVRHVELSLEGSGLRYAPGDALGVWHRNPRVLVDTFLAVAGLDGDTETVHDGKTQPLREWLARERELTRLSRPLVQAVAARADSAELRIALERPEALKELFDSHQPIDLLRAHPADWDADGLVAALRPLTPRLYSIASSPQAVGEDEVHLTLAVVDYHAHGERHLGAASRWIADADEDATLDVFIEPNERFRLPADGARDVIMIGPGTGVAPFRAFVQARQQAGGTGRNWLVFGNRHVADDFLYQVEWQQALKDRALHRLDVAFSRDQAEKRYVQHVLRERGAELYDWLSGGAHLYVCGDAAQMAKDVHAALADIVATHGGKSPEAAQAWLSERLQDGRYARDVY
ncbi:sulfite reductase (NADPH) [Dyella thiooxydans]|uniref:Sulfite reductase [NADPH] flavoprotein alpha-component n=1 Tax=Dyella thiooxydans TaxID=445710 RepID=A0A160MXY0_9GAMM|nr:assimilatory sulfite reductase (NADPH) flavoprotein subunit [Dyella thiooxydans]AND68066.1 sulfite reductase (NADPH) [Dyella thiooxydans]